MSQALSQLQQQLRTDFPVYGEVCLKIKPKNGGLVPFKLNKAQRHIHEVAERQLRERGYVRIITVKGRQQGLSTYIEGRLMWKVSHRFGVRAYILTHEQEATSNLFEMAERYYQNLPSAVKPVAGAANAKELYFSGLDSGYKVGTAGNRGAGRSQTLQYFHGSEVAFWPHAQEHAAGALQAVPKGSMAQGTEVWLESTANGVGNFFHKQWQLAVSGQSDFEAVFIPWFWEPGYSMSVPDGFVMDDEERAYAEAHDLLPCQMVWRRAKIAELDGDIELFKQEYPATADEAFRAETDAAFVPGPLVAKARKAVDVEPFGPRILGVDVARFGDDRTAICMRQGRVIPWVKAYSNLDLMDVTGRVVQAIKEYHPQRVFVDATGLGSGVVDRLKELGYGRMVVGVQAAGKPINQERYLNKRAEMWGEMREWLKDDPCQIPDDDALAGDLCSLSYKFDSKGRYQLEKKEDAKRRGVLSPDLGDCVALTFAAPVSLNESASFEPGHTDRSRGMFQPESFEPSFG